ncbi:MAG: biosynthetic arginine decarboxylase [Gammaproteobacteria bacterium]|nr:biosynthetic arginine decarboxylase [Gammaproteobacteria bacterium]
MNWTPHDARRLYNIPGWSGGYFDVGNDGHLLARPGGNADAPAIDLKALVDRIHEQGLTLPVLVRFTDILHSQVDRLCGAFATAMRDCAYSANYTAIYPIKVNQQQHVVNAVVAHGDKRTGLECGSKPELMAVIGSLSAGGTIICNGYKDAEYIRLALIAQRLGHRVVLVIEKLSELELIINTATAMQATPELGLRVRLSTVTSGNWQNTGGDRSKFGFTAGAALALVERLQQADMLDCLTLLHCHPGSQITGIEVLRDALLEVAYTWVELCKAGAPITTVDVGGGLAVDYEGTASQGECSMNYDVARYAKTVVGVFAAVTASHRLPQPDLMTESGRALTAHHAVLITNVLDTERVSCEVGAAQADDVAPVQALRAGLQALTVENALDSYHAADTQLAALRALFLEGEAGLQQRARGESLYYALCSEVQKLLAVQQTPPPQLDDINRSLADKVFCNLSVFQSMPDVWGIDQLFPIVPLQRLDEPPQRRAILHDLTCDSDGHIDRYVDADGAESTLPVHAVREEENYLLGFFLLGAYQEILGDMHNLFGDTDAVNVELDDRGGYRLVDPRHGDSVDELLRYVEFDPKRLMARYREKLNAAGLTGAERSMCLQALEGGLAGTTYMEDE